MLEGIRAIGEAELARKPLIEALIDTKLLSQAEPKKPTDRNFIVTLDIHLDPPILKIDFRELDEPALRDVVWVGNAPRAKRQDRFTTNNPEYLASQTVLNLLQALPPDSALAEKLNTLVKTVYLDLGEKAEVFPEGGGDQQYERYHRIWDLRKLGISGESLEGLTEDEQAEAVAICREEGVEFLTPEFLRAYARRKGEAKAACELVGKILKEWVARQLCVKSSQIKLYTLALDGKLFARHPDYTAYIEGKLVDEAFAGLMAKSGICHVCGVQGYVTADTTRFALLKFYITDKPGFASGLNKAGFLRNYTLCKHCYRALLAGERFVENNLRTRLGNINVYVIPTFHASEAYPSAETLRGWAEYLKTRLAAAATLEGWHKFQQKLEAYQCYEKRKAFFVLNLLFATKSRGAVKVDKLIPEVPPSQLDRLDMLRSRLYDWASQLLGESPQWDLSLGKFFYLLPLRLQKRNRERRVETKPYLEMLDALLTGRPVSCQELIPKLLETACIHRFQRYETHVHKRPEDPDQAMMLHLLSSQLFLCYLKELGQLQCLNGGEKAMERAKMQVTEEVGESAVDPSLQTWMDELGLSPAQRGLFLLGVLIGEIGSTSKQIQSKKPILNKIHFQGMDRHKLIRLANEVYEKLRHYKIAEYNEALYAVMKAYLDRSLRSEELNSPQENVYWVLSGYAYATWQAIRKGQPKRQAEDNGAE